MNAYAKIPQANHNHVLVIDDEPLIRQAMAAYLEELGYRAVTAANGAQGLARAREQPFDMVLVDLRMPRVDGMEVIATLKADQPKLPIVVVSGTGVLDDVVQAIRAGAWDYISKPIQDMDEIGVVMERVLEKAHLIAERDLYQQRIETLNKALEKEVARRIQDLRLRNRDLTVLNRVISAATAALEPDKILQVLCGEIALAFGLPQATAISRGSSEADAAFTIVAEYCQPGRARMGREAHFPNMPALDLVMERHLPLYIAEAQHDARLGIYQEALQQRNTAALLLVPLVIRGRVVSVLMLESETPRVYDEDDLDLIQNAAVAAAQALEAVRLHQELRERAEALESTVAQRTAELRVALKQARAADEAKSQFVSNVSHELRTPLSSIRLYLRLIAQSNPAKQAHYLESLGRETHRLQTLIEDLLDISRLDLGKARLQLRVMDVNHLLSTLVQDRASLFAQRHLALTFDPDTALPPISGDPELLEQVITNLLTNAMHYTPPGGSVRLQTEVREMDAPWVTLSVADTGPGISEAEQPQLFQRFFRGAAGQDSDAPGTGLGLAICREIVKLHQGEITLESALGEGATFTVWLPAHSTTTSTPMSAQ